MAGTLVYGLHPVEEALKNPQRINRLLVAKEAKNMDIHNILELAKSAQIRYDIVPISKLNSITGTFDHQGIAAETAPIDYLSVNELLDCAGEKAIILVLDQIQLERNVGMIIRTAAAAGALILLVNRGGALLDENIVRASAGMVFHVPVGLCNNAAQALRKIKDSGYWVYGMDMEGDGSVFAENWPDRCAIVLGNESKGIRPGVRKNCDRILNIPMKEGIESLNVAVSAGIVTFQAAQKSGLIRF